MYMERASLFVTVAATMAADKQEAANNRKQHLKQ